MLVTPLFVFGIHHEEIVLNGNFELLWLKLLYVQVDLDFRNI
jgi:hypothetical protein